MPTVRPLPTVIGPTENALRALLTNTLSATRIKTYPAWVVLNAAANAEAAAAASDSWRRAVGDALKVAPIGVDEVLAQLAAAGLVSVSGSLTALGATELATARVAVARTTAVLVDGINEDEQAVARQVLERIRHQAEHLLSSSAGRE